MRLAGWNGGGLRVPSGNCSAWSTYRRPALSHGVRVRLAGSGHVPRRCRSRRRSWSCHSHERPGARPLHRARTGIGRPPLPVLAKVSGCTRAANGVAITIYVHCNVRMFFEAFHRLIKDGFIVRTDVVLVEIEVDATQDDPGLLECCRRQYLRSYRHRRRHRLRCGRRWWHERIAEFMARYQAYNGSNHGPAAGRRSSIGRSLDGSCCYTRVPGRHLRRLLLRVPRHPRRRRHNNGVPDWRTLKWPL